MLKSDITCRMKFQIHCVLLFPNIIQSCYIIAMWILQLLALDSCDSTLCIMYMSIGLVIIAIKAIIMTS